jgi:hypothetical protein
MRINFLFLNFFASSRGKNCNPPFGGAHGLTQGGTGFDFALASLDVIGERELTQDLGQ